MGISSMSEAVLPENWYTLKLLTVFVGDVSVASIVIGTIEGNRKS
jgi:hypothetical protein